MSPTVVGVSLKAYLGVAETTLWVRQLRDRLRLSQASIFVCLPYPMLAVGIAKLAGSGIGVGSQDVSRFGPGPHTGEVPAEMLAELGAGYIEVGHAERRIEQGETDAEVAEKVRRCGQVGLTPVICVGEAEKTVAGQAARSTVAQLRRRLERYESGAPLIVAYEPEWAISAAQAAEPAAVRDVVGQLRALLNDRGLQGSVLYGGSATAGTYLALCDDAIQSPTQPDGLFIGRAALDVTRLGAIVDEVTHAGSAEERTLGGNTN